MTSVNLKPIHKRLGQNRNETGVDLDYHLCHMIHCVKNERKCGLYSSLKKKIFDVSFLFVEEVFLFLPLNPRSVPV